MSMFKECTKRSLSDTRMFIYLYRRRIKRNSVYSRTINIRGGGTRNINCIIDHIQMEKEKLVDVSLDHF